MEGCLQHYERHQFINPRTALCNAIPFLPTLPHTSHPTTSPSIPPLNPLTHLYKPYNRLPAPLKENPTTPHPCAETDSAPQKSERGESNEVAPSRISPDRQKDEKMSFVTQPSPLGEEVAGTRSKTRVCKTPCKLQVKNNSGARKAESKKAVNACFVAGSEEFCREDEGGKKGSMGEA